MLPGIIAVTPTPNGANRGGIVPAAPRRFNYLALSRPKRQASIKSKAHCVTAAVAGPVCRASWNSATASAIFWWRLKLL